MEIIVNEFIRLLLLENQKQNLVSRRSTKEELKQHVIDSLKVLEMICLDGLEVIDIGSGAGFPGLVLAIYSPRASFSLVEADQKKNAFLQRVTRELGLSNVRILLARAEALGRDQEHRQFYDICTSRAVAPIRVMLEYGLPLLKIGGSLLLWKGPGYPQEMEEAGTALRVLGGKVNRVFLYQLGQGRERSIVELEKEGPTPERFPRRVGIPAKRPL